MENGVGSAMLTQCRVLLGILTLGITEAAIHKKDLNHECVVVYFQCKKCGHKFSIQYEIINESKGKAMEYGHYQICLSTRRRGSIDHSFAFVQQCFDKMWQNYRILGHNCYHWARDFCSKLDTGNPNAFVYGYYG
uniref:Uncharacterized protein n=1 Tax=Panagrolaimus davidi TaxID=227884 RepID=A0A914PDQ5_9BILA